MPVKIRSNAGTVKSNVRRPLETKQSYRPPHQSEACKPELKYFSAVLYRTIYKGLYASEFKRMLVEKEIKLFRPKWVPPEAFVQNDT